MRWGGGVHELLRPLTAHTLHVLLTWCHRSTSATSSMDGDMKAMLVKEAARIGDRKRATRRAHIRARAIERAHLEEQKRKVLLDEAMGKPKALRHRTSRFV